MKLPENPHILVSMLNMKLRDGDYESLAELCDNLNLDMDEVIDFLKKAGFDYIESMKQFR